MLFQTAILQLIAFSKIIRFYKLKRIAAEFDILCGNP